MLSEEMKKFVLEQRLGYHATVNPDGTPNLSHKGTTSVYDDEHLFFADIRSPQTVANLRANPAIEVNVVDVFSRRGYRFTGTATVHEKDEIYRRGLELLHDRQYDADEDRVRSIVLIRVQSTELMTSPAYDLGQTETELVEHYIDYYVGRHRRSDSAPPAPEAHAHSTPNAVRISNSHERVVEAPPERVQALVADFDRVWPTRISAAPRPISPGLYEVGRMLWQEYERPGAARAFRVVDPKELRVEHWFEVERVDRGSRLRHVLQGDALGKYATIWSDRIEPLHNRVLEAFLNNVAAEVDDG